MGDTKNITEQCRNLNPWARRMTCRGLVRSCRKQAETKEGGFIVDTPDGGYEKAEDFDECLEKARSIAANDGPIDRYVMDEACRRYPEGSSRRKRCEEIVDECNDVVDWPVEFEAGDRAPRRLDDMRGCVKASALAVADSSYVRIGDKLFEDIEDDVSAFFRGFRFNSGGGYQLAKINGSEINYSGGMVQSEIGWDIYGDDDPMFGTEYFGRGVFEPILYGVHRYSNLNTHDEGVDSMKIHQVGLGFSGNIYLLRNVMSLNLYLDTGFSFHKTDDISDLVYYKNNERVDAVYELDWERGFFTTAGLGLSFLKGMFNLYGGVQYTDMGERYADVPLNTTSFMFGATVDAPVTGVNIHDWTRDKAERVVDKAIER